ncbi:uncharacterized protein K441DRAFT_108168 [Cenococcum geophilum 1.58]|uniref:uncharacterized protein n=1 Tax=Cenococcum geophilum 1.58 TaxID=794803 RepID=UPI00358EBF68|nr:hypothetical protein K441DRAFT_108168 [Cenococcum geophilum 1.58]
MTAKITGYSVYQGLATSLDTLCGQAYGAGRKHLVGVHLQRMICFLMLVTIPIGGIWLNGTAILRKIVPDDETVLLAGLYLKVIVWGAPGYAIFESGKRYVQAQGLFNASLYVLLIGAPFNLFLNWLLVWVSPLFRPCSCKAPLNLISLVLQVGFYWSTNCGCDHRYSPATSSFPLCLLCQWP